MSDPAPGVHDGPARASEPGAIVVLGATGCVGSRLVRRLARPGEAGAAGRPVRALVRRAGVALPAGVAAVQGDLLRPETLGPLFAGASVVYYLVHAMGKQSQGRLEVATDDRAQARNALAAIRASGETPRVVYVSGLGASATAPSAHLRGRFAVEEELRASGLATTIFRAGVILGPGSVGFEVLLKAVRLALVPLPRWTELRMQPFALADLLDALVRAGREPAFAGRTIPLGIADTPSYAELFLRCARAMGFDPRSFSVPWGFQPATPAAIAVTGGIPLREAASLTESMFADSFLVDDGGEAMRSLGIPVRTLEDALRLGLRDAVAERAPA